MESVNDAGEAEDGSSRSQYKYRDTLGLRFGAMGAAPPRMVTVVHTEYCLMPDGEEVEYIIDARVTFARRGRDFWGEDDDPGEVELPQTVLRVAGEGEVQGREVPLEDFLTVYAECEDMTPARAEDKLCDEIYQRACEEE